MYIKEAVKRWNNLVAEEEETILKPMHFKSILLIPLKPTPTIDWVITIVISANCLRAETTTSTDQSILQFVVNGILYELFAEKQSISFQFAISNGISDKLFQIKLRTYIHRRIYRN